MNRTADLLRPDVEPEKVTEFPPVWRAAPTGEWLWVSPEWMVLVGQDQRASAGWGWLDAIVPEDRSAVRTAWANAGAAEGLTVEARVITSEGRPRRYRHRAAWSGDGRPGGWVGVSLDLEAADWMQAQQRRLLAELQHRSRNMLATVRSLIRQGAETAEDVEDFVAHLDGRLGAMSRALAMITRDPHVGIDLRTLIADELATLATREGEQLTLNGPPVELRADLVQPIALTIHELATNAVKFGALTGRDGRIEIRWKLRAGRQGQCLDLCWSETAPPDTAISFQPRRGFGTTLIESGLPYQIDATVRTLFAFHGVRYEISIPLLATKSCDPNI